jgi:SAM-dependent methyltransferase
MILGAKLIGYDASGTDLPKYTQAIAETCTKFGMHNQPADLAKDNLPFADDYFDVILLSEVLEHFNFHPLVIFQEIARVLKKGGCLIITTPNLNRLNNVFKMVAGRSVNNNIALAYYEGTHYREYNKKEILFLLQQVGLKSLKCDFVNFKYPQSGIFPVVSDFLTQVILKDKKRDLVIVAQK